MQAGTGAPAAPQAVAIPGQRRAFNTHPPVVLRVRVAERQMLGQVVSIDGAEAQAHKPARAGLEQPHGCVIPWSRMGTLPLGLRKPVGARSLFRRPTAAGGGRRLISRRSRRIEMGRTLGAEQGQQLGPVLTDRGPSSVGQFGRRTHSDAAAVDQLDGEAGGPQATEKV